MKHPKKSEPIRRVVFSGGPAAGKTAILEVLGRHLEREVVILPESATVLFQGGFPRPSAPAERRLVQQTIFTVQHNLEEIMAMHYPERIHVCDRGTLDGGAYWPDGLDAFLGAMRTTLESEFRRYDAVIFLESSAHDPDAYPASNPLRTETPAQARELDDALAEIWSRHPNFVRISCETKFYEKVAAALFALHRVVGVEPPEGGG